VLYGSLVTAMLGCGGRRLGADGAVAASGPTSSAAAPVSSASAPPPSAVATGGELLRRSTFADQRTLPWMSLFIAPAKGDFSVKDGAYCVRIDEPGKNVWDVQVRHREMTIVKDHTYAVRFTAWASAPTTIQARVGMSGPPYSEYWSVRQPLSTARQSFASTFKAGAPDDPTAELAFHLNSAKATAPIDVCIDDIHLTDPDFTPPPRAEPPAPPPLRVNQVGYPPRGAKRASWVIEGPDAEAVARIPEPFEVLDSAGHVVCRGTTEPTSARDPRSSSGPLSSSVRDPRSSSGPLSSSVRDPPSSSGPLSSSLRDPTSGLFVQRLDFSSCPAQGDEFRLAVVQPVGGRPSLSDPFSIRRGALTRLSRDALRYFYYTRSGIALEMPYVENPIWARPAGHPTDVKVPCAPDAGCTHVLDVSGGWYDAGDYGKYVVNGGLSTWLLFNLWEVAKRSPLVVVGLADRDLNVPESGNGVPDLLDEARWELEWMLKMQVPEGDPQAGLVHHKMHDADWSALATPPVLSESNPRQLRPVSTAATLNLAAVAAQGARIFATIDPPLSRRCLEAARRAWAAAESHPALLIGPSDHRGGGAYEDAEVGDERFWAAAELFVTTGEGAFLAALRESPYYLHPRDRTDDLPEAFSWRATEMLGLFTLALGTGKTPAVLRDASRKSILAIAERYLALSRADAFGQPYAGEKYAWGSNSFLLDNGIVLAYAHAITNDPRFLDGASAAMDYVLGRNALGKSYVTEYGSRPLENPHHRAWARSANPRFPPPPPGVVAGGPNSALQDPYSRAANAGCIGQTCYVDHIEAYSANEVAINWNAALAWLSGYLSATQ
jgi:endoglucanase